MFTTSCLLRDNSGKHTFTMVTCERIMLSFFLWRGFYFLRKLMKLLESSPTVVLIWCHCLVSQYSFKRFYMQYLIRSMQQSTLPIAPSTIYVYLHDYVKDPWIYHWRLEISRRRKVSKGRISPSKLSPQDIKSVISKFPHLLKVQPWRDIKGCALPSKSSTRE